MAVEKRENQGITKITVSGFKSLRDESSIEVRPLTILAGANSSGKSSIMQPLLLMKQTLESDYDPGAFLLNGPNARFTTADQFLSKARLQRIEHELTIGLEVAYVGRLINIFAKPRVESNLLISSSFYKAVDQDQEIHLWLGMRHEDIIKILPKEVERLRTAIEGINGGLKAEWIISSLRCFLYPALRYEDGTQAMSGDLNFNFFPVGTFRNHLHELIHIPGLRANPRREYPLTFAEGPYFEGTFDNYTASLINHWEISNDERLAQLKQILNGLNLTSQIVAEPLNDVQIEIRVGRTRERNLEDTVSIANVGFGVSQVLPVLVVLLVAEPGQLVYIEQPELHLHPRAQVALAQVLADAANRGVRVVVETHSALLINGVQTLIAQEKIAHDKVILHWFKRGDDGYTTIDSQEPDKYGAYGDWPEDFAEVQLEADSAYLNAVEKREFEDWNGNQKSEMPGD